ncbi:hypothetical protein FOZ63_011658 [Perkinsus olseni]|uniref:Uncharacterized protein n=1 Tax=Perkinsus olseni TaxID=32597 RepID=A0A7J6SET3_PEROL|nr:hypothetical protein FOZ62_000251 [Perkinsus olseni]KAF4730640.1 hypothetical protein FOZ63_011658 [Perkinsus olseni]
MSPLIGVILLLACSDILLAQPSGKYCGTASTLFGDATIDVTITSPTTFDISATFVPAGGTAASGTATGVRFTFKPSTGDITVTDTDKLQDLINKIGAPISAADLASLKYQGKNIIVVNLGNFVLKPC